MSYCPAVDWTSSQCIFRFNPFTGSPQGCAMTPSCGGTSAPSSFNMTTGMCPTGSPRLYKFGGCPAGSVTKNLGTDTEPNVMCWSTMLPTPPVSLFSDPPSMPSCT